MSKPKNTDEDELQKLAKLVKEVLAFSVTINAEWSVDGAKALFTCIPTIRGYCARLEEVLFRLERVRARFLNEKRKLAFEIEKAEDAQVEEIVKGSLSWEERASIRRTKTVDERLKLVDVRRRLDIVDVWHRAVDRRYILFLGAKADAQGMANLLRIGNILGEIE